MADDARRQSRGAQDPSLEQVFKRLGELERRQVDCEDVIHCVFGQVEQNSARLDETEGAVRDAVRTALQLHEVTEDGDPAAAASGEVAVQRPGRPRLRVILGGLAATVALAGVPAAAAAVHHAAPRHHVSAVHVRRRADRDTGRGGATMRA